MFNNCILPVDVWFLYHVFCTECGYGYVYVCVKGVWVWICVWVFVYM